MTVNRGLQLIDALASEGQNSLTSDEVRTRLGLSPQAASNLLHRLTRDGLIEPIRRGNYLIRQLGELGVAATSSDRLDEAVVVVTGDRLHRICYRTALQEHGLLTRPSRIIQVAVNRRLYVQTISARPLESITEPTATIHLGVQTHGVAQISTVERSLLEAAHRPRRVGGIATVAEALNAARPNIDMLTTLNRQLHLSNGLRRLLSLDSQLQLNKLDNVHLDAGHHRSISLDPADPRTEGSLDPITGVRWPGPIEELAEIVNQ